MRNLLFSLFSIVFATNIFLGCLPEKSTHSVDSIDKLSTVVGNARLALSQEPDNARYLKDLGIALHNLAHKKVNGASKEAVIYLEKAVAADGKDFEALAYLGSAHAMLGRDSRFVVNKVRNVNKGLSYLDRAVKTNPENIVFRLIRGGVTYKLPEMFGRRKTAFEDYHFVEKSVAAGNPLGSVLSAEAYYKLGMLYTKKKDNTMAKRYFLKALDIAPGSNWAALAKKEIR